MKLSILLFALMLAAPAFAQEPAALKSALESLRLESRCRFEVSYATDGMTVSGCFPLDPDARLPDALIGFFDSHKAVFQAEWFAVSHKERSLEETFFTVEGSGAFTYYVHVNEKREVVEVQMVDYGLKGLTGGPEGRARGDAYGQR